MPSKKLYNLFASNKNLSRKDIDTYRSSTDEEEKQEIEQRSLQSSFEDDALEGWTFTSTGTSLLDKTDKKFLKNRQLGILLLTIGCVLAISVVTLHHHFSTETSKAQEKVKEHQLIAFEKTDLVLPQEIEAMDELPQKDQISTQLLRENFSERKKETEIDKTDVKIATAKPQTIEVLPLKTIEKVNENKPSTIERKQNFGVEMYLHDLKLLDYRLYRSKPSIQIQQLLLEGTPASMEDQNSEILAATQWGNASIPYVEYLQKTMSLFADGSNKKALSRFEIILKTYPDDINALFYGGLSFYNLGEYQKAITAFEKCLNSRFLNFSEEAEWYLSKSYRANGQIKEADLLLHKINEGGGYYAK